MKEDGRLYHRMLGSKWENKRAGTDRLCIPKTRVLEVLREFHERGHFSYRKCYRELQKRFFWRNMYRDARDYCRSCTICQERNPHTAPGEGELQKFDVSRKFELVHLDLFAGVPKSHKGNVAVLVMTDYATKYVKAVPVKDKTQRTAAKVFLEHWVKDFAFPERILTDEGGEFKGILEAICELLKIRKHTTTEYHPQANGQVEAKNKTMIAILSKHCADKQKDWDKFVAAVWNIVAQNIPLLRKRLTS